MCTPMSEDTAALSYRVENLQAGGVCEIGWRLEYAPDGELPVSMQMPWQEWQDSNPRPSVLETDALPAELHSSGRGCPYSFDSRMTSAVIR